MTYTDINEAWQRKFPQLVQDFQNNNPNVTLKTFLDIHALSDEMTPHVSSNLIQALIVDAPDQVSHVLPWVLDVYPVSPKESFSLLSLAISLKNKSAIDILVDFGWTLECLSQRLLEISENKIAQTLGQGEDLGVNRLCPDLFTAYKEHSTTQPFKVFLQACISKNGILEHSDQPSKPKLSWEEIHSQFNWAETEKIQTDFNVIFADVFHSDVKTGMMSLKQFHPRALQMVFEWEELNWLDMKKVENLVLERCKKQKRNFYAGWFSEYNKHQLSSQTLTVNLSRSSRLRL